MTTCRWLHLTDLHFGMAEQSALWPNVESMFLQDLKQCYELVGPWDIVFFTGDLTQRGTKAEFDALENLLNKIWSNFSEWGFNPKLLAIPGNHDLVRPSDENDPTLITLLDSWNSPRVQTPFWTNADCPQRVLISSAFQNYTEWWKNTKIPKPVIESGVLPGDCSVSLKFNGFSIGVLGLNSAYLQLTGDDFKGKLHLDIKQANGACNGHMADWVANHDASFLLSHHPTEWLSTNAQQHFIDEIHYPPERFCLHLFGHMHENSLTSISHGGAEARRTFQGNSLFGLEYWGKQQALRAHGYSLGELKLENHELKLRFWPRKAEQKAGGGRGLERDTHAFTLVETDGGTRPIVIKQLNSILSTPTGTTVNTPKPNAQYQYDLKNPSFNVPYRQKGTQVIGRAEALLKVREQLTQGRCTAIGQAAVFQGLGGLGKTQLAVEYAYSYRSKYPNGVIWLTADQDIDAQLVDLAIKSRWVAPESEHSHKLDIARHRVRSIPDCLIVFDNLEEISAIKDYLPEDSVASHILATSRTEQPDFSLVELEVLNLDQSLLMLAQESSREPKTGAELIAAKQIATSLGGLPLALEIAGAYLARRPVSWQNYNEMLELNIRQALPPKLSSLTKHAGDIYATLQISQQVFIDAPLLKNVLDLLSWSAPAPMGLNLLTSLLGLKNQAALTDALCLGQALRILQHTPEINTYSIHRLVREVRREEHPLTENMVWAADVCQRIANWFEALREDFVKLPQFEAEIDHLREWKNCSQQVAPKLASKLTWLQAYPAFHRRQLKDIKQNIKSALDEFQKNNGNDPVFLAHLYNDMSYAESDLGNYKLALELSKKAYEIRLQALGELHPETASSLNNMSVNHNALGNYKLAHELAKKAYEIRLKVFGEHHPDVAQSLNNISAHHYALGNYKLALELAKQAYEIRRKELGEHHPDTAKSLSSMSVFHSKLGDSWRALELAKKAYEIRLKVFGEYHPDTASSLGNVATCHSELGNNKLALELFKQVYEIQVALQYDWNPVLAMCLQNMGKILSALKQQKEAHAHVIRALAMREKNLGAMHPDSIATRKLLGSFPGFRVPVAKGHMVRKKRK